MGATSGTVLAAEVVAATGDSVATVTDAVVDVAAVSSEDEYEKMKRQAVDLADAVLFMLEVKLEMFGRGAREIAAQIEWVPIETTWVLLKSFSEEEASLRRRSVQAEMYLLEALTLSVQRD